MKKRRTEISEDLRDLFEDCPRADEAYSELKAREVDWERNPVFVAEYLKAQFVNDLILAMEDSGVSRSELAARLGESRQYISRVLNEKANFTLETMARLACALELRLSIRLQHGDTRTGVVAISGRKLSTSPTVYARESREEYAPKEKLARDKGAQTPKRTARRGGQR